MGWFALWRWYAQMVRQLEGRQADPESWDGREQDQFWAAADERRRRERGR